MGDTWERNQVCDPKYSVWQKGGKNSSEHDQPEKEGTPLSGGRREKGAEYQSYASHFIRGWGAQKT